MPTAPRHAGEIDRQVSGCHDRERDIGPTRLELSGRVSEEHAEPVRRAFALRFRRSEIPDGGMVADEVFG